MGFDIPEPFVWDDSFKVFYDNLDDEHRTLFKAVFECAKDPSSGSALANLVSVTGNHFKDEEGMMKAKSYGSFGAHKKAHDDFLGQISGLKAPLDSATLHFAKDWLVNHIKGIDFNYKGTL
uniref:Hemerythrin n=1 Tax=Phascolosoma agassizii TaxID=360543 RepID=A0A1S6QCU7_9ANNE|nr:hemerythrin [Phascolosoma agassizii]